MDKRLIFCVLLVTLPGRFVGTYAVMTRNITTTPASNMITTAGIKVTNPTNMSTTPASKVTTTAKATVASLGNNSTTPASNVTATAEATVTMAISTQFSTVSPNTAVPNLETNITKDECGSQQLCVAEPSSCDPSITGSCFFLAAKQQSGRNFNFHLSGESNGYIAATLTGGVGEGDPTYVCANSNGKVKFFGSTLKNGVLTISVLNVTSMKGKVKGKTIQCSFLATVPEPATRATNLGFSVSTGEYNDTNENLGAPAPVIKVSNVDLENPNSTITNEITNTTTQAPTPNNASTVSPVGALIPQLSTTITRQECGSAKLCAAEPSECDPAAGGSCYFLSVKQQSGQIYTFELSGQSEGYVAAGLSPSVTLNGTHIAYICAKNNGAVRFITATIENLELNLKQSQNSSNEQGKVDGSKIQCTFSADLPDTTTRAAAYALSVSTGSYDANTFQLGRPSFHLLTRLANLSDPTANLTNLLNGTTSYAPSLLTPTRSFLPALLVTVCMLAFTAM
ncbi:uncharacterized protein LOC103472757 [Poecilia reticulata]|uniref:uncharacterized protein LOC103472757 n=1 Tax=Poecilia reticulata TaxID=8081 RepID=UPI0004A26BED|nr:PREDICTED: uncharacterized protein LOC103472757 [Poecilia reticulata]